MTYYTGKWSKKKNLTMHLPKTNLYIPSDSWDEEVKSWAITIRKVPVHASCSWTSSGPLKKHFMATKNLFSIMWASSATALHLAEPPVQQECHRQSGGRIIVQPSVSLALLKVSQILLLSSPFLPKPAQFCKHWEIISHLNLLHRSIGTTLPNRKCSGNSSN